MLTLFPFQEYAVNFLLDKRASLIGDEMGLGKSIQAVTLDRIRREKQPNLVRRPKTLVITYIGIFSSWVDHFETETNLRVITINPRNRAPFMESLFTDQHDVYVVHWQALRLLPELAEIEWFHIIGDECLVAGTPIDTPTGPCNVEDLKIGDVVYGYNHSTQQVVPTTVRNTFAHETSMPLFDVNGVTMTANHPVWTNESNYIDASTLDSVHHTLLRLEQGKTQNLQLVSSSVSVRSVPEQGRIPRKYRLDNTALHEHIRNAELGRGTPVYNIETGTGNYFANGVLIHNCHALQNRKSKQTLSAKKIKGVYKTGLSGTPAYDKPDDLWSILNWLYPKYWTSFWRYYDKHIKYIEQDGYRVIVGVNNVEDLQQEMAGFYLRRRKQDVLLDLPDKYHTEIVVELDPKQKRAYQEMKKNMLAWVGEHEDEPVAAPVVIAQLTRLQQFSDAYGELEKVPKMDRETGQEYHEWRMRLSEPSSKLDAVMDIISSTAAQIVVFSQFSQVIELLAQRLEKVGIPSGIFIGSTSSEDRKTIIREFQAGKLRVFAGTIAAGGIGITLTAASTVVFIDRSWSASLNIQAEDRCHRISQKNAVQIIDIVSRNTLDAKRIQKINLAWGWIKRLIGDDADLEEGNVDYNYNDFELEQDW